MKEHDTSSKRLASHQDSFEYTLLNLKKSDKSRSIRQYFIRQVFLPQRSKRAFINSIHSLFSFDLTGLCSDNQLNAYVILLLIFVYCHSYMVTYICWHYVDDQSNPEIKPEDKANLKELGLIGFLVLAIYPLVFAIFSVILLVFDLTCGKHHESMFSWHRNSLIKIL